MLSRFAYVLLVLAVILGGAFVLDFLVKEDGSLTLNYAGRIWELTLFESAIGLVVGVLAILLTLTVLKAVIALLRFVAGDKDAFGAFFARRRERAGLDALSKSMIALAAGDPKLAKRKAALAERKLMRPELTRLINAQAYEMAGDGAKAETYYKALMADESTAFVGTQGLLSRAIDAGDTDRALKLALHAKELAPKDPETLDALYTLQSQKFDWEGARKTLSDQRRVKALTKYEAARRESGLILAQAEDAEEVGEIEHARALAVESAKLDPTNVNAVSTAVRHLVASGSRRAASKLVTDAWRARPHPTLAAAFASIEPDEAPAERRRRFEALFALHPEHDETRYVKAELCLVAGDFRAARTAIQDLRETEPSVRSCAIMAAISRGEGEPEYVVRGWLARALGAPRDRDADGAVMNQAAMLPLLIGAPEPDLPEAMNETETPGDGAADAEAEGDIAEDATIAEDEPTDQRRPEAAA